MTGENRSSRPAGFARSGIPRQPDSALPDRRGFAKSSAPLLLNWRTAAISVVRTSIRYSRRTREPYAPVVRNESGPDPGTAKTRQAGNGITAAAALTHPGFGAREEENPPFLRLPRPDSRLQVPGTRINTTNLVHRDPVKLAVPSKPLTQFRVVLGEIRRRAQFRVVVRHLDSRGDSVPKLGGR